MLKAVIFDFDGVIVDTEPAHLLMFQKVLKPHGIQISEEQYYDIYLAMDDRTFFKEAFRRNGIPLGDAELEKISGEKARAYAQYIVDKIEALPGSIDLVKKLGSYLPLAIASMALKTEIVMILNSLGLRHYFKVIISAEEVSIPKPDPEVFLRALDKINSIEGAREKSIEPSQCLVIEDSTAGIEAAKSAGMKCLGVVGSRPAEELKGADLIVDGLDKVKVEGLEGLFLKGV